MSLSRLGLDKLARKWMVPDVPTDLEQSRELGRAATRRFKLLRRTRGFYAELSRQFSDDCVSRARDRAVTALRTAGLTGEAELLANDPIPVLGENRIDLWFRIQAPAAEAAARAKVASAEAESAHKRADEAMDAMPQESLEGLVDAGLEVKSALYRGFEAAQAQDRAYAAGGAASAARALLAAAGSLVESGHPKGAANIAVLSANAAMQAAAAQHYALTEERHDDLQRLFHEASVGELRLQSKWLTQHFRP
jgi:hypothetical protein